MVTFEDLRSGKVKPEFGNLEHIAAIKNYLKEQERLEKACPECDGEGMVECQECDGTGEKKT